LSDCGRADVDVLGRKVAISGTLQEIGGKVRWVAEGKTPGSRQTLSIPPLPGRDARATHGRRPFRIRVDDSEGTPTQARVLPRVPLAPRGAQSWPRTLALPRPKAHLCLDSGRAGLPSQGDTSEAAPHLHNHNLEHLRTSHAVPRRQARGQARSGPTRGGNGFGYGISVASKGTRGRRPGRVGSATEPLTCTFVVSEGGLEPPRPCKGH
jgi:hypothetical protein